jgi:hypothetical protein
MITEEMNRSMISQEMNRGMITEEMNRSMISEEMNRSMITEEMNSRECGRKLQLSCLRNKFWHRLGGGGAEGTNEKPLVTTAGLWTET